MPLFHQQPPFTSRVTLMAGNAELDRNLPYLVVRKPVIPITTGTRVNIHLPYHHRMDAIARIGRVTKVYRQYVEFRLVHCNYNDMRLIALPWDWVQLSWFQLLWFQHQIRASILNPITPLVYHPPPAMTQSDTHLPGTAQPSGMVRHVRSVGVIRVYRY
jgi:hypothetical protein